MSVKVRELSGGADADEDLSAAEENDPLGVEGISTVHAG